MVYLPRAPADRVARTSSDFHESGIGMRWFIKTPQLALLENSARLPHGLSTSSYFHNLAVSSSSLQPALLAVD